MTAEVVVGDDGLARCGWAASTPEYRRYHDDEWGRPVGDDDRVFEKVCLEGFQAGLSWLTILRKRDAFRSAFASFDPRVVATFGDAEVERLVRDPGIVRHRAKILGVVTNAKATVALGDRGISLAALVWDHRPAVERARRRTSDVPPSTPESEALSKALRREGFTFVGPTTVYAAMQSLGVVNDHLVTCDWHAVTEAQRRTFQVPTVSIGRSSP